MSFLQRSSAEIFYTTWGTHGEWVTLLNGFMRTSSDFSMLANGLMRAGFQVLALDNRGTGRTTYTSDFTMAEMAEDIVAVWEAAGITTSHVIGFSMGGLLAQLVATGKSSSLSSLALVSSCLHPARILRPTISWNADVANNQAMLAQYVSPSFSAKNQGLLRLMAQSIATAVEENHFTQHATRQLEAMRTYAPPAEERLRALACPVLLLHGKEDALIPLEEAYRLQSVFKSAQMAIAEDAGHLLLAEKGTWLSSTLLAFLS